MCGRVADGAPTVMRIGRCALSRVRPRFADHALAPACEAAWGRIAGENAARFPAVKPGLRRALLGIVFTDPQIAIVGGGYAALEAHALAAGEVSFEDQGRSRVMLRNDGLLRVYGEPSTGRFLGAEMVGPDAEHIGHLLAWALQEEMTVAQMLQMPFYHPVVEEGLRTALRDLDTRMRASHAPPSALARAKVSAEVVSPEMP